MNFFGKISTSIVKHGHNVAQATERKGVSGYLVDKGERYGSMAVFSFLKGYYREKAVVPGTQIPLDVAIGGTLTLVAAALEIWSGGRSRLAPHLNAAGDGGMMSWIGSHAAAWGAKKSGRKVYVLKEGAAPPAQLPPGMEAIGAIPPAVGGAFLSADEISKYCEGR